MLQSKYSNWNILISMVEQHNPNLHSGKGHLLCQTQLLDSCYIDAALMKFNIANRSTKDKWLIYIGVCSWVGGDGYGHWQTIPTATNTKFWVISIIHLTDKCSYTYSTLLFRKLRVQTYWREKHGMLCITFDLPSTEQFKKRKTASLNSINIYLLWIDENYIFSMNIS